MSVSVAVTGLELELGGREILRGVDLDVPAGAVVAIMGLSGSGKTSLLRCLAGLQRPTRGSIRIGETEIAGLSETELNERRRTMGMVFQYAALFDSLTVFENVVFGLRFRGGYSERELREIAHAQLISVGLEGTEDLLPAQLSGGMRKRVGLARALAVRPEVVFYDEPTSGLDPVVARMIDDLILDVRDRLGITSVIVSHDVPSVLRTVDRAALLHEGRIMTYGTPQELRESRDPMVRQFIEGRAEGPLAVTV